MEITLASQQGTPWLGFNGFGGGFGDVGSGWTLAATGVWTAPDGTSGWARNPDGTYTSSVVDGLGNVIVYTVTEAMVPVNTMTVPPALVEPEGEWWTRLSDVAGNLLRVFGLGTPASTTPAPVPAGGSLLNPGTWSLPMVLLIGGGVYWLASSSKRTRTARRSRARQNPRLREERNVRIIDDKSYVVRNGHRIPLVVQQYGMRAVMATSPDGSAWISRMTANDEWGRWHLATLVPR